MVAVFLSEFSLYIPKGAIGETWVEKVSSSSEEKCMNVQIQVSEAILHHPRFVLELSCKRHKSLIYLVPYFGHSFLFSIKTTFILTCVVARICVCILLLQASIQQRILVITSTFPACR